MAANVYSDSSLDSIYKQLNTPNNLSGSNKALRGKILKRHDTKQKRINARSQIKNQTYTKGKYNCSTLRCGIQLNQKTAYSHCWIIEIIYKAIDYLLKNRYQNAHVNVKEALYTAVSNETTGIAPYLGPRYEEKIEIATESLMSYIIEKIQSNEYLENKQKDEAIKIICFMKNNEDIKQYIEKSYAITHQEVKKITEYILHNTPLVQDGTYSTEIFNWSIRVYDIQSDKLIMVASYNSNQIFISSMRFERSLQTVADELENEIIEMVSYLKSADSQRFE
jgi:hypothetical protein